MKRVINIFIIFLISSIIFISCDNNTQVDEFNPTPYTLKLPEWLPTPSLPDDNPLTIQGIKLGNKLFFEKKLSRDNSQSCGSCHNQQLAFTDNLKALSVGIRGLEGKRNSMPIFNMFYHKTGFFWDGRSQTLREQSLIPIEDHLEMDDNLQNVVEKLKNQKEYPQLFFDAFGNTEINPERLGLALEQYMLSIVSGNSKYDRVQAGLEEFTPSEERGFNLFFAEREMITIFKGADCFHCHSGPNFSNNEFMNNGLDKTFTDLGLGEVTKRTSDNGKFKVPSLRNIEVTPPYMHDGRFKTLEEVVRHYNSEVKESPTLDPNMHGSSLGLNLDDDNINDLVNFLKTLTDSEFLNNPEYYNQSEK